jgi:hypothetical protein
VISADDVRIESPAGGLALPSQAEDVAITWSASRNEVVFVTLLLGGAAQVLCRFPASARSGVLPGALVARALAEARVSSCGGDCNLLQLTAIRSTTVRAGDYEILVSHGTLSSVAVVVE